MITSTSNTQIKEIRSLNQRKFRKESSLFYVEGLRAIASALENRASVEKVVFCAELLESDFGKSLLQRAEKAGIPVLEVSRAVFESISLKENPQGMCAVVRQNVSDLLLSTTVTGLWVALEGVQDPGNLGSILRTLDAVGGKGLILIGEGTDAFHPTSVRASTGAIFSTQLYQCEVPTFIRWKQEQTIDLIGAVCDAHHDYRDYNYAENTILCMGSEQKGLPASLQQVCTSLVTIPMIGTVDSLNLANAASVLLYEYFNQHHPLRKR
ncbi:MAG TPA: RNA methyltransferase [Anaerolineaceae bacterium]|nr:RNA methyltransferase [Anaerolineaceae bacterium]